MALVQNAFLSIQAFGKPSTNDPGGFIFFTNYNSRKGQELAENPNAAVVFYWEPLKRSVRIEGTVEKVSKAMSEEYFDSRPFGSQIGAAISNQSQVIANRDVLTSREQELRSEYENNESKKLEKPPSWGGYRILAHTFEFWQGQSTRVHDRIRFRKQRSSKDEAIDDSVTIRGENDWLIERLSP